MKTLFNHITKFKLFSEKTSKIFYYSAILLLIFIFFGVPSFWLIHFFDLFLLISFLLCRPNAPDKYIVFFLIAGVVCVSFSLIPDEGIGFLFFCLRLTLLTMLSNKYKTEPAIFIIFIFFIVALLSKLIYVAIHWNVYTAVSQRLYLAGIHSNAIAGLLLLLTPFVFLTKTKSKIPLISTAILLLILTYSRAGLLSLIIFFLILLFFHTKSKRKFLISSLALIIIFLATVMCVPSLNTRFIKLFTKKYYQKETRLLMWKSALKMWKLHPVTGIGPKAYTYLYSKYGKFPLYGSRDVAIKTHCHNLFIYYLAMGGILLFSTFILLLYKVIKTNLSLNNLLLKKIVLAGFLAFLFHNLFDYFLFIFPVSIVFFLTISYLLPLRPSISKKASIILKFIIPFIILLKLQLLFSTYWEFKGRAQFYKMSKLAVSYFNNSLKFNRNNISALRFAAISNAVYGNLKESLKFFKKVLKLNGIYYLDYENCSWCLFSLKKFNQALVYMKKAFIFNPHDFDRTLNFSAALLNALTNKKYSNFLYEAILKSKKNINKPFPVSHYKKILHQTVNLIINEIKANLKTNYVLSEKYKNAFYIIPYFDLNQAIKLYKKFKIGARDIIFSSLLRSVPLDTIEFIDKFCKPTYFNLTQKAYALLQANKIKSAAKTFEKAIKKFNYKTISNEITPLPLNAYLGLAQCYLLTNKFKKCSQYLEKVSLSAPFDLRLNFFKLVLNYKINKTNKIFSHLLTIINRKNRIIFIEEFKYCLLARMKILPELKYIKLYPYKYMIKKLMSKIHILTKNKSIKNELLNCTKAFKTLDNYLLFSLPQVYFKCGF